MTANTGCFAWKITRNKWPLLFPFQTCDSNERERRSSVIYTQTQESLARVLASIQEDGGAQNWSQGTIYSLSLWGLPKELQGKGKEVQTCAKVLKQVFHFLKNPFRWRVGMPSWNADKIFLALRAHDLYPVRSVSLAGDEGVSAA